jgi:hypothetical protein
MNIQNLIVVAASVIAAAVHAAPAPAVCELANWNDYSKVINWVDDKLVLGQNYGIVQAIAGAFDPLNLDSLHFPTMSLNALNREWDFDATIDSIVLDGLDTITLNPISIGSPTEFNLGG